MGERFDYVMSLPELTDDILLEYDRNYDTGKYQLTGLRKKHFARCSTKLFNELINELQNNKDCGYVTHINNVVKDGYVPKYISVRPYLRVAP